MALRVSRMRTGESALVSGLKRMPAESSVT